MKFTQHSFPSYVLGLSTVGNWLGFFLFFFGGGVGLMLYLLKLFHLHPSNPQWSGG